MANISTIIILNDILMTRETPFVTYARIRY